MMGLAIVFVVLLLGQSSEATWGSHRAAYDNAPADSSGADARLRMVMVDPQTGESVTVLNMHYALSEKSHAPIIAAGTQAVHPSDGPTARVGSVGRLAAKLKSKAPKCPLTDPVSAPKWNFTRFPPDMRYLSDNRTRPPFYPRHAAAAAPKHAHATTVQSCARAANCPAPELAIAQVTSLAQRWDSCRINICSQMSACLCP